MKLFLILPILYSLNLLAMGDPTFVPAVPNVKESQPKREKKQMQQETKPKRTIKGSQKATKGDLWANQFSTHYATNTDILKVF
jgi:hypothetical protein